LVVVRGGRPTAPALFALAEARRVASALGATVYALVVTGALDAKAIDQLPGPLGASGADKVFLCVGPAVAGPPVYAVYAGVLDLVVQKLRPRLFLWPAGNVGLQLAPAVAARAGAAFFPRAALDLAPAAAPDAPGTLVVRRWSAALDGHWSLPLTNSPVNVVATLAAGRPSAPASRGETELQLLSAPPAGAAAIEAIDAAPDADATVELAATLVVASGGERETIAAEIGAAALHGAAVLVELPAAALGDASPTLVVLVGGKPYPPALARLRVAPGADVVLVGKRVQAPTPLVSALWQVDRAQAVATLAVALGAPERTAP
jgi:electron transfer flavoprotein alpha subunit